MNYRKGLISLSVFMLCLGSTLNVACADTSIPSNSVTPAPNGVSSPSATTQSQSTPNNPTSAMSIYNKLHVLAYNGQSQQGIVLAQEYLKIKDDTATRILLGRMLGWNKDFDGARKQLNIVLSKGSNADASEALADVEIRARNYQRAVDVANEGLKNKPSSAELINVKQEALAKLHDQSLEATASKNSPSSVATAAHAQAENTATKSSVTTRAVVAKTPAVFGEQSYYEQFPLKE